MEPHPTKKQEIDFQRKVSYDLFPALSVVSEVVPRSKTHAQEHDMVSEAK